MSEIELDPRWEWHEIANLSSASPAYIKGRCKHTEVEPVTSVTGEEVAQLCLTCDSQLPPARGYGSQHRSARHGRWPVY